jgi:serine/threonine protein kinase
MTRLCGWETNWKLDDAENAARRGGQGTVRKVRRKEDNLLGALKELHDQHLRNSERRFRMQEEVNALLLLAGNGTPRIYDTNASQWQETEVPLYAVMEWIEGDTLANRVSGKPRSLDEALGIVDALLKTVEECHRIGIFHRDLKPDNIILRDGGTDQPVLVDFGMAWCRPEENTERPFDTDSGQEIGNRFLRLPEYTANRHVRDPRSDLTLMVGLLFYLVTGQQPRSLADPQGNMPHQSQIIPNELLGDRRWDKLSRFFSVGFQYSLDRRFQSVDQIRRSLGALEPTSDDGGELAAELHKWEEFIRERGLKEASEIGGVLREMSQHLVRSMSEMARSINLDLSGSSLISPDYREYRISYAINLSNFPDPRIAFVHRLRWESGDFVASWVIEATGDVRRYYRGPVADVTSLKEAVTRAAKDVFTGLLARYREKLAETGTHENPVPGVS